MSPEQRIEELEQALSEIAEFAHDNSAGPAFPDEFWSIRDMAYAALETQDERRARVTREISLEVGINQ
jgi:hypothetical protein